MDTVCCESGEADRVEPEEDLLIDGARFVGNFTFSLVLPPDEYECDVGCDSRDDDKHRVLECHGRS